MTGGTINTPAPASTATVPRTAHNRPTHRGISKRRSSWSVIAEKYTAARAARKTRMRTSATRRTNQMTRAATKSATNVAPGDRAGDGSVLSGRARRRRPGPARLPSRPSRAAWPRRESRRGAVPASASARAAAGACLRLPPALDPRRVPLPGRVRVLVGPPPRRLRQVAPPLLPRQHRALLPIAGALLLLVPLRREPLLVRDGARHLLLGLRQLTPHVHDQLVQHLLRVLGARDQVADVRPDQRGETVKDPHGAPRRAGGSSLTRAQLALPPLGEQALGEI